MWIVCITSVRHVLTVNGYGGRQTKENEKSWCFKGWETLVTKNKQSLGFVCVSSWILVKYSFLFLMYRHGNRDEMASYFRNHHVPP